MSQRDEKQLECRNGFLSTVYIISSLADEEHNVEDVCSFCILLCYENEKDLASDSEISRRMTHRTSTFFSRC